MRGNGLWTCSHTWTSQVGGSWKRNIGRKGTFINPIRPRTAGEGQRRRLSHIHLPRFNDKSLSEVKPQTELCLVKWERSAPARRNTQVPVSPWRRIIHSCDWAPVCRHGESHRRTVITSAFRCRVLQSRWDERDGGGGQVQFNFDFNLKTWWIHLDRVPQVEVLGFMLVLKRVEWLKCVFPTTLYLAC